MGNVIDLKNKLLFKEAKKSLNIIHEFNNELIINDVEEVEKDILSFKERYADSVIVRMFFDESMSPIVPSNCYLFGRKTNINKMIGKNCIIGLTDNSVYFRKLRIDEITKDYFLQTLNPQDLESETYKLNVDIDFVAEVIMIRNLY